MPKCSPVINLSMAYEAFIAVIMATAKNQL